MRNLSRRGRTDKRVPSSETLGDDGIRPAARARRVSVVLLLEIEGGVNRFGQGGLLVLELQSDLFAERVCWDRRDVVARDDAW